MQLRVGIRSMKYSKLTALFHLCLQANGDRDRRAYPSRQGVFAESPHVARRVPRVMFTAPFFSGVRITLRAVLF